MNSCCELQASRSGFDRLWMLEAEKQRGGNPPAICAGSKRTPRHKRVLQADTKWYRLFFIAKINYHLYHFNFISSTSNLSNYQKVKSEGCNERLILNRFLFFKIDKEQSPG